MLHLVVVLLCIVLGVFGQEPPPSSFTDDYGNKFSAKVDGAKLMLYNSSGVLLSNILNENGWVVVLVNGTCVIVNTTDVTAQGDCFEEVPYSGVVPDYVTLFCRGKAIVKHVRVNCTQEDAGRKKRQSGLAMIWPNWGWCCRWRPVAWWPCSQSVCLRMNTLRQCVSWGCGKWHWHWHWVRICIWGYSWPWWG